MNAAQENLNFETMLQTFNNELTSGDVHAQRKQMEEKFVKMMNSQFGLEGLFFSIDEKDRSNSDDLEKPVVLSLYHDEKFERVGVLDTKDKFLLDFCDTTIERFKETILNAKKELITIRREVEFLKDEYTSKKRNIFNWIFRRKMLKETKERLDIKKRILHKKEEYLDMTVHNLELEKVIKNKVKNLMSQLSGFGFESESA